MIHNRLKFTSLLLVPRGWSVESWIGVWVNGVSLPVTGSKYVSPHWGVLIERNRSVCGWLYIYISIRMHIYTHMFIWTYVCMRRMPWGIHKEAYICIYIYVCMWEYLPSRQCKQYVILCEIFSRIKKVWIQRFFSLWLVATARLKRSVYPTICL